MFEKWLFCWLVVKLFGKAEVLPKWPRAKMKFVTTTFGQPTWRKHLYSSFEEQFKQKLWRIGNLSLLTNKCHLSLTFAMVQLQLTFTAVQLQLTFTVVCLTSRCTCYCSFSFLWFILLPVFACISCSLFTSFYLHIPTNSFFSTKCGVPIPSQISFSAA